MAVALFVGNSPCFHAPQFSSQNLYRPTFLCRCVQTNQMPSPDRVFVFLAFVIHTLLEKRSTIRDRHALFSQIGDPSCQPLTIYLDFDLCRKILLRLEEVLIKGIGSIPARYVFSGYSVEMVGYAVRKLHDARLIQARDKSVWTRDQLRCWPLGFKGRGLEFLAAAKEEDAWQRGCGDAGGGR